MTMDERARSLAIDIMAGRLTEKEVISMVGEVIFPIVEDHLDDLKRQLNLFKSL